VARVLPNAQDGGRAPGGSSPPGPAGETAWPDVGLADALDQHERELIARALSAARGNVAEAARRLSTDRANLYRRMRRLGIEPPRNTMET
jgi:transcriptional regulator with GAF, ATPase, and Fis domain